MKLPKFLSPSPYRGLSAFECTCPDHAHAPPIKTPRVLCGARLGLILVAIFGSTMYVLGTFVGRHTRTTPRTQAVVLIYTVQPSRNPSMWDTPWHARHPSSGFPASMVQPSGRWRSTLGPHPLLSPPQPLPRPLLLSLD